MDGQISDAQRLIYAKRDELATTIAELCALASGLPNDSDRQERMAHVNAELMDVMNNALPMTMVKDMVTERITAIYAMNADAVVDEAERIIAKHKEG
jgi:hypothetical protein